MIYAVQLGKSGPIKFGRAVNVKKRLSQLQISQPKALILIAAQETNDDKTAEREIHASCKRDRIRGEWFQPSKRVRLFARKIKQNMWWVAWAKAILEDYRKAYLIQFIRVLQAFNAKSIHSG